MSKTKGKRINFENWIFGGIILLFLVIVAVLTGLAVKDVTTETERMTALEDYTLIITEDQTKQDKLLSEAAIALEEMRLINENLEARLISAEEQIVILQGELEALK